jgi:hypothetical protein
MRAVRGHEGQRPSADSVRAVTQVELWHMPAWRSLGARRISAYAARRAGAPSPASRTATGPRSDPRADELPGTVFVGLLLTILPCGVRTTLNGGARRWLVGVRPPAPVEPGTSASASRLATSVRRRAVRTRREDPSRGRRQSPGSRCSVGARPGRGRRGVGRGRSLKDLLNGMPPLSSTKLSYWLDGTRGSVPRSPASAWFRTGTARLGAACRRATPSRGARDILWP